MGCLISCCYPTKEIELVRLKKINPCIINCALCGQLAEQPIKISSISKRFCSFKCWEKWLRRNRRLNKKKNFYLKKSL